MPLLVNEGGSIPNKTLQIDYTTKTATAGYSTDLVVLEEELAKVRSPIHPL